MSLNLIDQAALRKRIDDLLSNPVESAKELEQLRLKLADSQKHVTLLRDALKGYAPFDPELEQDSIDALAATEPKP